VRQYVILGAGLDTFAQRRPDIASQLQVYEVDQEATQSWKRQRLLDLGYGVPEWLHLVPVDFETGRSAQDEIAAAGFDRSQPAVVASSGVSMYLTREANIASLSEIASLAPGSVLALSFLLTQDLVDPELRRGLEVSARGAAASGTPFVTFFTPEDIMSLARAAGFGHVEHVSAAALNERYFAGRTDGLKMLRGEELIVATV
jgi:methyltransferase (TIGR00027 family)